MMGVRTHPGAPAPVAALPPRQLPKSVHFSMARSVHFSVAIDSMPITDSRACRSPWSERVGALENLL